MRPKRVCKWSISSFAQREKRSPILSAIGILLLIMFILLAGCDKQKTKINVNDYIVVHQNGYDGCASIDFSINYEQMLTDIDAADAKKQAAILLIAQSAPLELTKDSQSNCIKNGEIVSATWKPNKDILKEFEKLLNVDLAYDDYQYTVAGLRATKIYDPFSSVLIETNGSLSGFGHVSAYATITTVGDTITIPFEHNGENGKIANGDTLTLSIAKDFDYDAFTRKTGLIINKTTHEYTVEGLGSYVYDDTIFNHIGRKENMIFDTVINDWILSGLNDENYNAGNRTYKIVGYALYTNASKTNETEQSCLFAICEIDDKWCYKYYTFIGLEGSFSGDHVGLYNNGKTLSDSFIDYKKEKIRYSEEFGWSQGSEQMGFLFHQVAYAGHLTIDETISQIDSQYGEQYANVFFDPMLQNLISK